MIFDAVLIFFAYVILDIVWARYTIDLASKSNWALAWAPAIPVLGGYVVIEYVENPWMLIPVAFGAVAGTYLGMHGEWVLAALRGDRSSPASSPADREAAPAPGACGQHCRCKNPEPRS